MEIGKIQVSGVKAALAGKGAGRWEIPAGIIGATLRFSYGADWMGLTKTVVFDCGGITKDVVNAGEVVTVPAEVVARPERKLLVGVYGVGDADASATPTLWLEGYVCAAADPSGDVSTDPSLPVWAQLEARIRALEARDRVCGISYQLTHTICDGAVDSVPYGNSVRLILRGEEGYDLKHISVTMDGADITAESVAGDTVTITSVTGDVLIRAVSEKVMVARYVELVAAETAGFALVETGVAAAATENWVHTHYIPVAPGQHFRYTGDTSSYEPYVSVCGYDASGGFAGILVPNGYYGESVDFTIPAGVSCIRCCYYLGNTDVHGIAVLEEDQSLTGLVDFTGNIVLNASGAQSDKAGAGATDFISVTQGSRAVVYNIVPHNGGRFLVYNSARAVIEAVTIYTQGVMAPSVASLDITDSAAAYVRISTNVLADVKATVRSGEAG